METSINIYTTILKIFKEMKKVRLTNKQKRIRFAVILITTALVIGRNLPIKKNNDNFLDNFDEVVVVIKPGDRAWNIQSSLTPNKDVRELLYYVSTNNDKNIGELIPGEEITFYKNK